MQPNKWEAVKQQTSKFEGIKLPSEIKVVDRNFFHVVLIESTPVPPTGWKHNMKVQTFDKKSWHSTKDNLARLGYQNVFVLHDPELMDAEADKAGGSEGSKDNYPEPECSYGFMKSEAAAMGYEGSQKKVDLLAFFAEQGVEMATLIEKEKAEEAAGQE